jgi:cell division protein ZapA
MSNLQPISITILDKEYKVACPAGEQAALLASAKYLDEKMREVRDSGHILGSERIAVITALNIANDFLNTGDAVEDINNTNRDIKKLDLLFTFIKRIVNLYLLRCSLATFIILEPFYPPWGLSYNAGVHARFVGKPDEVVNIPT